MARRKSGSSSSGAEPPAEEAPHGPKLEAPEPDISPEVTPPGADPAAPDPDAEPAKVIPITAGPVITLSVFARRFPKNAIMRAFQDGERLAQSHTRKRTRREWQSDFDAFLKAPR